jgi:hypothetical protein
VKLYNPIEVKQRFGGTHRLYLLLLLLLFTAIGFAHDGSSPTLVQTKTRKQDRTVVQHNTIIRICTGRGADQVRNQLQSTNKLLLPEYAASNREIQSWAMKNVVTPLLCIVILDMKNVVTPLLCIVILDMLIPSD